MKDIKHVLAGCRLSYQEVQDKYKYIFEEVKTRRSHWYINVVDKIEQLREDFRPSVQEVITKLEDNDYRFVKADTAILSTFVATVNGIIKLNNWINNFKEAKPLENGKALQLFSLFNTFKDTDKFDSLELDQGKALKQYVPHLFSIVKHCQKADEYPIYYKYWRNILGTVLQQPNDYDSLCEFYQEIPAPKHLNLGSYFDTIGELLAREVNKNQLVRKEGDRNYNFLKHKIYNINFELIKGYETHTNYFLIELTPSEKSESSRMAKWLADGMIQIKLSIKIDLNSLFGESETSIDAQLKELHISELEVNAIKSILLVKERDQIAICTASPESKKDEKTILALAHAVSTLDGNIYHYDPKTSTHNISVEYYTTINPPNLQLNDYHVPLNQITSEPDIQRIFNSTTVYHQNYEAQFTKWLKEQNLPGSNKDSSYVKAIHILSELREENLFLQKNIESLEELYQELLKEQTNDRGKYYYPKAPSYGASGFYSAAISSYMKFLRSDPNAEGSTITQQRLFNKLRQAICVIGISGVGKTYRVNKTLEYNRHKSLMVIVDSMWQHILFDYSPEKRIYTLTKVGNFIKLAHEDKSNHYTIVFDECHKNLEIINDVLLQALSTKRNDGLRFISLNTLVDPLFDFLEEKNGNRIIPENLGFVFISSKSDIIRNNDDLCNRIEIVELEINDQQAEDYSLDFLLSKIKKEEDLEFTL